MASVLTPAQFGARFTESVRILWTVATGVLGDDSLAEDVLQEACIIGLGKLEQFEPGTSFTAWMGRIVRFVALNQVRTRGRRGEHLEDPARLQLIQDHSTANPFDAGPNGGLGEDRGHFDDEFTAALACLTPTARACLLLKTFHDLAFSEIGSLLGIPDGTAMSHVHRSRVLLRRRLAQASDKKDAAL